MTSIARQDFLDSHRALSEACDNPAVKGQDSVGRVLRKGLTVASFNILEGFVGSRWDELATYANTGHTQFQDIPEKMQKRILERTVAVSAGELKRAYLDLAETKTYLSAVGNSIQTLLGGLALSGIVGRWEKSNMSASDLAGSLSLFHVDSPWVAIRDLTSRFGFRDTDDQNKKLNLNETFTDLARTRNQAAHEMNFNITTLQLRTIPTMLLQVAFGFDILASVAIHRLRSGNAEYLSNEKDVNAAGLGHYTLVMERRLDHALYRHPSKSVKAKLVDRDGNALFSRACNDAKTGEFAVRMDLGGLVTDWSISGPG